MRAVTLLALALPLALAGCLNPHEDPHYLRVVSLDVAPASVLASDVVLNVTTNLDNRGGGQSGELRLVAKAFSEEKGFLLAQNETHVGIIPGDTSRSVPIFVTVPREGSVRIQVILYEDDQGTQNAAISARNLHTLEPEVEDTGLRIRSMDFIVRGVEGQGNASRATIQTDLYLTNEGRQASQELRLQVKARELSTSLVADVQWIETGGVQPGTTVIRSVNLTVPDGYNYAFEILTWKGDVIVARSEGIVQLAPTLEKRKDTEMVTTNPDVNQFIRPTASPTADYANERGFSSGGWEPGMPTPAPRVPGFGAAALVLAAAAALLIARRRSA